MLKYFLLAGVCLLTSHHIRAAAPAVLQDFESGDSLPKVWVVNLPAENASLKLTEQAPHDGKQCLQLHYQFSENKNFQYLGIPIKVKIDSPVQQISFWIKGDNSKCGYGVQVSDSSGETHQFSKNTGQGGTIDFADWKQVVIDLEANHETWGGDKNHQIDYPITSIVFTVSQPTEKNKPKAAQGDIYFDSLTAQSINASKIAVVSPEYCSQIKGDTAIKVSAAAFKRLTAKCWKQGEKFGADSTLAEVELNANGEGEFVFHADDYPHGPVVIRLSGEDGAAKDNCYLQLYNTGGVSWNEGLPKDPPEAAKGMTLVFADDFDKPLSISSTDTKATYYDHKPPGGWQDFSAHTFSGHDSKKNPFAQMDSYLRIRASDKLKSAGILSSMKNDATGITARVPCYFECRFLGPNAPGTWPGFWLLTDYMTDHLKGKKVPCDELDIIEAYGGEGRRSPNAFDSYMITPHSWDQGEAGKAVDKKAFEGLHNPIRMKKFGIPSAWYETFHTYACKITETDTIYYCDNIEVGRHATYAVTKQRPLFFLIDLATGGGWPVDLSRYNGTADMYVDYVRVFSGAPDAKPFQK